MADILIEGLSAEEAFNALKADSDYPSTSIAETVTNEISDVVNESNGVSNKLPSHIDTMLQDMAQMYGLFDYKDIIDFNPTADDIKVLKAIYRRWAIENQYVVDYSDEALQELANKVLSIIDKDDEVIKAEDDALYEGLDIGSANIKIPAPYDKYFIVSDYDPEEYAGEYMIGDVVDNYNSQLLAYLQVKPEYAEFIDNDALLVDDPEYPVVEIAGGRMYPLGVKGMFEGFSTEDAFQALCENAETDLQPSDSNYYLVIANELGFDIEFYAKLVNRSELISEIVRYIDLDRFDTSADILMELQEDEFEKAIEDLCMAAAGEAYLEDVGILIKNNDGKVISGIDFTLSLIDELQDYEAGNDVIQKLKTQQPFTFTFERDINDYGDFVDEGTSNE